VRAIELLRRTGSPQQDGPGFTFIPNMAGSGYPQNHPARPRTQRIGNRPDLRQLVAALEVTDIGPIFEMLLVDEPHITPELSLLLD
jgi:hypothetical protein